MESKNGKGAIIAGLIFVIAVVVGLCIFTIQTKKADEDEGSKTKKKNEVTNVAEEPEEPSDTGSFNEFSVTTKGYTLNIDSTEPGHPVDGSLFSANFVIEEKGERAYYAVDYEEIAVYEGAGGALPIINTYKINGKRFDQVVANDANPEELELEYWVPDTKGDESAVLRVKILGLSAFDKNGDSKDDKPEITEDVINSEELAGILNFTIEIAEDDGDDDIETVYEIELDEEQYIDSLVKLPIEDTGDYFEVTKNVKWEAPEEDDGNTTVSFSILVPYTFTVDGEEYEGHCAIGSQDIPAKDDNPKYNLEVTDLTKDGKIEICISEK